MSQQQPPQNEADITNAQPGDDGQVVTPWEVDFGEEGPDYEKLCRDFGCSKIDDALLARFEKLTGKKPHRFLRRGIFYTHRDLNDLLDNYEKGTPFYLYTGRGPSSESLHVGHLVPFHFTKWLQEAFDVPLVIQLTDDEKMYFKEDLCGEETYRLAYENAKDIIAVGFNPEKTFIFSDFDYMGTMYPVVAKIAKKQTYSQAKGLMGFKGEDNIGKVFFPAIQAAPSFPASFPHMFGGFADSTQPGGAKLAKKNRRIRCLIPQAIDQDPYFRMTRDIAPRLGWEKPALIHSKFAPSLEGQGKMSATSTGGQITPTIFTSDDRKTVLKKVNKYAKTGGRDTEEEHRRLGADLSKDVPYEFLRYWMEDDVELDRIAKEYEAGRLLSGEVKKILGELLGDLVEAHQTARAKVTDETVRHFMDPTRESLKTF